MRRLQQRLAHRGKLADVHPGRGGTEPGLEHPAGGLARSGHGLAERGHRGERRDPGDAHDPQPGGAGQRPGLDTRPGLARLGRGLYEVALELPGRRRYDGQPLEVLAQAGKR